MLGILGTVVAIFVREWVGNREIKNRLLSIEGNWKGFLFQAIGPDWTPVKISLTVNLQVDSRRISGDATYQFEDDEIRLCFSQSKILSENMFQVRYDNVDKRTL